jgi:hypothetical protein
MASTSQSKNMEAPTKDASGTNEQATDFNEQATDFNEQATDFNEQATDFNEQVTSASSKQVIADSEFTQVQYNKAKNARIVPSTVKLAEFPALGEKLTRSQINAINESNKMIVPIISPGDETMDHRTASFAAMSDKETIAKALSCTKACRIVTTPFTNPSDGEQPKYGVCTRFHCSFAHSLEELQAPMCGFDGNCRFMHGKVDYRTQKKIPNTHCRFRHTCETIGEWLKRSQVTQPSLPETNEFSRKPQSTPPKPIVATTVKTTQPVVYKSVPPPVPVPVQVQAPKRSSSKWDKKPVETKEETKEEAQTQIKENKPKKSRRKQKKYESSSEESSDSESDESSDSSESESESESRKRRSKDRRRRHKHPTQRKKSSENNQQVIRVPTSELAAIAIKAAFDRGQYNVRVIVEE